MSRSSNQTRKMSDSGAATFLVLSVLACALIGWSGSTPAATYQVIDPPAGYLYVNPGAISQDGSAVAGTLESDAGNTVLHLWTATGGIQPILLSGYPGSTSYRISNDFSVLVGTAYGGGLPATAFVWSSADGVRVIDPLSGDTHTNWEAFSVDGSTVIGQSIQFSPAYVERAYVWTAATGTQPIAAPAPACSIVHFLSISNNGEGAVGYTTCGAMYWSASTGAQLLPSSLLPGAPYPIHANLISADGSKVAFLSVAFGVWRIGLWTVGGSAVEISPPPAESSLQFTPSKISATGSTVLLQSNEASGHHVFRWTEGSGSQSLTVPGIFSTDVAGNGMSADGATVILNASNDCAINCNQTAFVWRDGLGLQEIPPPAGFTSSNAGYVSIDGARVGGNFYGGTGDRGFVWSSLAGVETLEPVPGDAHSYVQTISADGTKVAGGSCTTDYSLCRGVVWTLSAPPGPNEVPTPTGDEVTVEPVVTSPEGGAPLPVQLTFDSVSAAGTTTVNASTEPSGSTPLSPPQFSVGDPPVYYDVDTTASFAGPVILCFSWQEGQFDNEGGIALFHYEGGAWQNVTTSVDISSNKVCGQVNNLSPFALFERPAYAFSGFFQPVDNQPTRNTSKAGAAIPLKFSLNGNQGMAIFASGYPSSQPISCSGGTVSDLVEETLTANASGLTYDPATDLYHYVWKTDKTWTRSCRRMTLRLVDGSVHSADFEFFK